MNCPTLILPALNQSEKIKACVSKRDISFVAWEMLMKVSVNLKRPYITATVYFTTANSQYKTSLELNKLVWRLQSAGSLPIDAALK
jgi:hypothetical protein